MDDAQSQERMIEADKRIRIFVLIALRIRWTPVREALEFYSG